MKFQKLTIHNIASIVDAVIDFENSALADSEVFLITGKTGSGKSTILDSICLALFANTPRLKNTKMEGKIKDGDEEVGVDKATQLMRRNSVNAYVELTFTGSNSVHYKAQWEVSRAHRKIDGNIRESWQLENIDTNKTLTKKGEIRAEIQNAIGLDFEQFCRTTMLAQGEFTRFLNSKDDEKAEILEKITGVDIYSRIGAKIFEINRIKKEEWELANEKIKSSESLILSEDDIQQKQEMLESLKAKAIELQLARNQVNEKLVWITSNNQYIEEVNNAKEQWQREEDYKNSEEYKNNECLVNEWRKTIDARGWMSTIQQAINTQKSCENTLNSLMGRFTECLGGYDYLQREISDKRAKINEIEVFLAGESDKSSMYENAQTIKALLNSIQADRGEVIKVQNKITELRNELENQLNPNLTAANENKRDAEKELSNIEASIRVLETEIANLNLSELRSQQQALLTMLNNINNAQNAFEQLISAKTEREVKRANLDKQLLDIETKKKSCEEFIAPLEKAKQEMDSRSKELDRQRDTVDKFAKSLRSKLQIDDVCPVCLQKVVQQLPNEEELAILVSGLEDAYNKAKEQYDTLLNKKSELENAINIAEGIYGKLKKEFEQDNSVNRAEEQVIRSCGLCKIAIETTDDSTLSLLQTSKDNNLSQQQTLEDQIRFGEVKELELQAWRSKERDSRQKVTLCQNNVTNTERRVNESNAQITTNQTIVDSKKQEIELAEGEVAVYTIAGVWNIDWKESPKEFIAKLTEEQRKYENNVSEKRELNNQVALAEQECQSIRMAINSIKGQMPSWEKNDLSIAKKIDNLLNKFNEISRQISIEQLKLQRATNDYQSNQQDLDAFLAENPSIGIPRLTDLDKLSREYIEKMNNDIQDARDRHIAAQTSLNNAQERYGNHQQQMPNLTENDSLELLSNELNDYDEKLNENNQEQGGINQELDTNIKNRERLQEFIKLEEQKKTEYQKWKRLCDLIGDSVGKEFRKIAQSYVLASLIHSANSYMRTLTDRYTLKVVPGTFIISLEDAYQGYVSRAASTISGGESFLVSLSLALALSDIGQTLSVDTLFIDEGFGTLSGEPLQNAINTLRSLHTKAGRHVGIISHIEELRERIPVQIQVRQEGNNSSSTIEIVNLQN